MVLGKGVRVEGSVCTNVWVCELENLDITTFYYKHVLVTGNTL